MASNSAIISQKRFVAGARCPKCSALDSTVSYQWSDGDNKRYVRECVECDFQESIGDEAAETSQEKAKIDAIPIHFE